MDNKRVRLPKKDSVKLFELIQYSSKYTTWNSLVAELEISSTPLKRFRRGDGTVSQSVFVKLLEYLDAAYKKYFKSHAELLDKNWGARKAGKKSIARFSKEQLKEYLKTVRSHKKLDLPLNPPTLENIEVCELFGALLGDGSAGRYFARWKKGRFVYDINITGNAKKDDEYVRKIAEIVQRNFYAKPFIRIYPNSNTIRATFRSKYLYEWLAEQGFPTEAKPKNFGLTKKALALPTENLNRIIRGLLDTDGCVYARKDEKFRYPYVTITSISGLLKSQIKAILQQQGLPAFIHANDVSTRGIKNFHQWFKLIGSSNPRNLNKYREFCETGKIIPKNKGLMV